MSDQLLPEWDDRLPWARTVGSVTATEILRGTTDTELVVVDAHCPQKPVQADLHGMWRARSQGGVAPVLVAVKYTDGNENLVAFLGLTEDSFPVLGLERALADQLIHDALKATSPSGLHTELRRRLASLAGVASGVRNEGLFASHVLELQPSEARWVGLCAASAPLVKSRGENLLEGLGFTVEPVPDGAVLRSAGEGNRRAAAVLLAEDESFENPLSRFQNNNAVMHGLALGRREHLDWLVVLGGPVIRLYPVNPDVGVGRKGQTQTYVELDLSLLTAERTGYLALLFSPDALSDNGAITELLNESSHYATGLSERLRDRIYKDVIPTLAVAVADKMRVVDLPKDQQKDALGEAYHQAMIILFRLLFVAYAEDRRLLPYEVSEQYTRNSLTRLALDLLERPGQKFDEKSTNLWDDLTQVWKVIDTGDMDGWGVPAYNGGLFTRDVGKNPSGAATYALDLNNQKIGPTLSALLIDINQDEVPGLVDFRSLSVREFGTIYEGLLESGLGIADTDLTLDKNETYVPAKPGDEVEVHAGHVYFHSRSGSRKATGSYFTKPFAVRHLLDSALEPAIQTHLDRVKGLLEAGATKSAGEALFDFRVADLSMGSAHFLVAAIDRIEARFSAFLIEHPLPEVAVELHRLRTVAATQLGLDPEESGIDDGQLLRRQIARRCIYGLDINEIAVELARLGIWIHTFVPGLPLSFLNHGLVWGNSLTGVGTLPEIGQAFADAEVRELKRKKSLGAFAPYLDGVLGEFLDRAGEHLAALGALSDASIGDVANAATIQADIEGSLAPLSALCDLITAERATRYLGTVQELVTVNDRDGLNPKQVKKFRTHPDRVLLSDSPGLFTAATATDLEASVLAHRDLDRAREIAATVQATHMPVRFPEVFRRDRPGFDCVLGNPPWEKLKVEEHGWWGVRFPGLRSMSQEDKNNALLLHREERPDLVEEYEADIVAARAANEILAAGPYLGLRDGTDIDLFAAFCWRFWHEIRDGGRVGVVLPRTAMSGSATSQWRKTVLADGGIRDLTTLMNSGRWAFDMEPRYSIALLTLEKGRNDRTVRLRGPFASILEYEAGLRAGESAAATVAADTILLWSDSAAVPLIPATDVDVFAVLRAHPPLDSSVGSWKFRPTRELHTTDNKSMMHFSDGTASSTHKLPVLTGGSFNLWDPDYGPPYAHVEYEPLIKYLLQRRSASARKKDTVYVGLAGKDLVNRQSLPMMSPRIVFRDVTNRTNSRTMVCALLPGGLSLVHKAPFMIRQQGKEVDEAYLLGVMSSIPFDWFARRFVELSMSYELLNTFPVPRVADDTGRLMAADGQWFGPDLDYRCLRDRAIEISGRLAAVDARYADWAKEVGVAVGSVETDAEKDDLIGELDALVSLLYGLSEEQVGKVFKTFHRGWVYGPRLGKVLLHYKAWASQLAETQGSGL